MKRILYICSIALLSVITASGCASSSNSKSYKVGSFTIQLNGSGPVLTVVDQYDRVILPQSSIEWGNGKANVQEMLGSFEITDTSSWVQTSAFNVIESSPDVLILKISSNAGDGYMTISPINNNMLGLNISAPSVQPINRISLGFACNKNDHFYGLGEQFNSLDQRGNIVGIWAQDHGYLQDIPDAPRLALALHPAYFPEPFMLTSAPAGVLISSTSYSKFDLCSTNPKQVRIKLWDSSMHIILISDKLPLNIVQDFTSIVGRQPLSPPWVIGPWISIEGGSSVLLNTAYQLRSDDIPSSAIWYQDWVGGQSSGNGYDLPYHWTPDFTLYPEMAGVNMTLNSLGFKAMAYFNSFVDESQDQWSTAVTNGYLITQSTGLPFTFFSIQGNQSMVDLSNPSATTWVQGYLSNAIGLGFSGWMADFGEWLPYDAYMKAGTGAVMHNEYPILWAKTNYELMSSVIPSGDFVFFMRSGYLGSQPYQPVIWAGDQNTDFDTQFGFPTAIIANLNMGISGVPIVTSDIAGYISLSCPPSTKELYFRWTELGCFTPVMRTHNGYDLYSNWNWNSDQDTINMFQKYANLHVALFPYIYTYMNRAHDYGTPIMRALWLEYPYDPNTATVDDEYLFGDDMLVAPVIIQGAKQRAVYLPNGNWYPFDGGNAVAGGVSVTVPAPMDIIPVFIKAGSVIPMLTNIPDTLISVNNPTVTTLAREITSQTIRVYPGANGSFTVYDGSSFTLASGINGLNPGAGVVLSTQSGGPIGSCSSTDTGAVGCGVVNGSFDINGSFNGNTIFTLQGTSAFTNTTYRIEVF
ncbi:MAG: hypothetical protein M1381_07515 [Deltaproteobacteria bacterium]|nr:hypothetical protein [Deltaproteobacteria bacterium]MCL5792584.1 hypothetical protein [Deltaproteobacteria bacterium]